MGQVINVGALISTRPQFFIGRRPMNYQAFTNDSLTMMYQGACGALAVDDALSELAKERGFCVRETSEWKQHAADLESEMLRRGMVFEVIDLSHDLFGTVHSATE
jgi:hypothetical protein